mgnify:CR=1 FL=1
MQEEQIENGNSLNAEQDIELTLEDDVDVEALKEQNKKLFERAKKAEGFAKQPDGSWVKTEKKIIKEGSAPQTDLKEEVSTIAEFIREGYDRDDVDFILKNGGRTALKDPNSLVSLALKSKTEQKRAEDAASKATSGGSGEIIGKVTLQDLSKMSAEEMKKHLPHAE